MSDNRLRWLQAGFITTLVVANVIAGKICDLAGFIIPAAFVTYGLTFLFTDCISELYGRKEAVRTVWMGFAATVFACLLILAGRYMPVAGFAQETQEAYIALLGMNWRIVGASMAAYLVAQHTDVRMFHFWGKKTGGRFKWLRNNGSTMVSQAIDTSIFISIAFVGLVPNLAWMMLSQYVCKLIVAALDTPFFYLITRGKIWHEFAEESKNA